MIKYDQSLVPALDTRPDDSCMYKVAAFCQECRYHLDLIIDYGESAKCAKPCPNREYPLHHFLFVPDASLDSLAATNGGANELQQPLEFHFRCTSPTCAALLLVRLRPPRLRNDQLKLLTDERLLQNRRDTAILLDTVRGGDFPLSTPLTALDILHAYLRDSLDLTRPPNKRRIPVLNRKYMVTFGQDCNDLLTDLGFTFSVSKQLPTKYVA